MLYAAKPVFNRFHVISIIRHTEVIEEGYIIALIPQVVLWCLSLGKTGMKGELTEGKKESG